MRATSLGKPYNGTLKAKEREEDPGPLSTDAQNRR